MLEVVLSIIFFALGVAYNEWRSRDQRALFKKIPDEVVKALQQDRRDRLTLDELEELVFQRGYFTELGIVPWRCPSCGSKELETLGYENPDPRVDDPYMRITCKNCGWIKTS